MDSRWNDAEARDLVADVDQTDGARLLALAIYASRLIGAEPDLVMHGGGNSSVKLEREDITGQVTAVMHVKGSGTDLGKLDVHGFPAVRLAPLAALRGRASVDDATMLAVFRQSLLDPAAPDISVESLLHAFLPHRFVFHTHATAMLALANQPDVVERCAELFGARVVVVPYAMPGFGLARLVATAYETNPEVDALLLAHHGYVTFGDDAQAAYERTIEHVSVVEAAIAGRRASATASASVPTVRTAPARTVLPALRGALTDGEGRMPCLDLRTSRAIEAFLARRDLAELARRGVATPDHVIRTHRLPVVLDEATFAHGEAGFAEAVRRFRTDYRTYFTRQVARGGRDFDMVDSRPRVFWVPGLGVVGAGRDAGEAAAAADLAEQTVRVIEDAEALGSYAPIGDADTFDMEYWPLERAKVDRRQRLALEGRVVLVTGAAGAIGLATARAFRAEGAEVFLVDIDDARLEAAAMSFERSGRAAADVTAPGAAAGIVAACVARFGGLDILVSNAGAAWTGDIATVDEQVLRQSFELNFWSHQRLSQAAVAVMRSQGQGGCLLFNVSKQAVNPGARFGPYGLPKSALLFLLKQYAVDHGADGIRSNGVNADRIRSGVLDDGMIAARAKARGLSEESYMGGNLLQKEVRADDVADAFVALAKAERTTGHVMTVDGGNIAASLR